MIDNDDYAGLLGAAIQLTLGGILLFAGVLKVARRPDFEPLVRALGLSSSGLVRTGIRAVPLVEILLGIWLLLGYWVTAALSVTVFIFTVFTVVLLVLRRQDYRGSCACFGTADRYALNRVHIARNVLLVSMTTFALIQSFTSTYVGLSVWAMPLLIPAMALVLLAAAAVIYVLAAEAEAFLVHTAGR